MTPLEEVQKLQEQLKQQSQEQVDSDVGFIAGTAGAAAQGLTFGFSDEIAAGISGLGSFFTDETFQQAFDRTLKQERENLEEFRKANPVASTVGEVVGSVAPVAVSLLLTPFTGGTSSAGAVASAQRILSNPLLAGKVTQPGLNLVQKTFEAGKLGALQGAVAGAGYAEGELPERAVGAGVGAGAGATLGTALAPTIAGVGKVAGDVAEKFKKTQLARFNDSEKQSIKIIGEQFLKDEIPIETVVAKINDNIEADKLVGLAPVEILADYGGDAVNRKLRGIKTRVPGMNIDKQLIERTSGTTEQKAAAIKNLEKPDIQSSRILAELEKATEQTIKTPKVSLASGIDDLSDTLDSYLSPLYETAFLKNQRVSNLGVYEYLETPVIRDAYQEAANTYREKLIAEGRKPFPIPPLRNLFIKEKGKIIGVRKELPLEFLDLIKKSADQQTFQKIREGSINKQRSNSRKKIANQFRNLLKDNVVGNEYKDALGMAADKFALQDAFDKGVLFRKPSTNAKNFNKEFNKLNTDIERDAFKIGVFQEIYNDINKIGDNIDLVRRIFDSPDLRQKLNILFGDDINAREQFISRLVRESNISKKTGTVIGGSNTAEKVLDAQDAVQALSDLTVAGTAPTSSAGIRAQASLFTTAKDLVTNPSEKRARDVGKLLLERNPQRQYEILQLIQELQEQSKRRAAQQSQVLRPSLRFGVQQVPQALSQTER